MTHLALHPSKQVLKQDLYGCAQVLADGICQQKVLYEHLKPLHNAWLQGDHMKGWEPTGNMECDTLVKLVDNCNPMLSAMLMVGAVQAASSPGWRSHSCCAPAKLPLKGAS